MVLMTSLVITFIFLEVQVGCVESVLREGTERRVRRPLLSRFNCVTRTMMSLCRGCGQGDKAQKFTLVYLEKKSQFIKIGFPLSNYHRTLGKSVYCTVNLSSLAK
jgi:hypothetical protein